ncbi:MAG: response regulator [Ruminococcus sp.]|jgi:signal transduction histidine kinase/CheY-like chemotaxis protein|nr:response regulator [Ruminococcus sp.]
MANEVNSQHETDLTESHIRRDELLTALNSVAILLMGIDQSESKLIFWNALRTLATPLKAATFSIWRNALTDEKLVSERIASWSQGLPLFRIPPCDTFTVSELDENWVDKSSLTNEKFFSYDDLPETIRDAFSPEPFKSLFIMPIMYHSEFWGILTLAFNKEKTFADENERGMLHSAGLLLASAYSRRVLISNLYEAKEAALESVKSKAEFLSRMSHEMRTPLNAIVGMAAIAKDSKDNAKTALCLDRIEKSSKQLLSIINDILDMSKIDANKMTIQKDDVNFEELLVNVYDIMESKAFEKNIRLILKMNSRMSHCIIGDELRITQILLNIVSNAVKFTPENGTIIIIADVIHGNAHIAVSDTGIGIAPENIPKLFNSFEQVDGSLTRRFGGTGLGLAICKKLVELMDGRIRAESELGKGTTFICEFPAEIGKPIELDFDPENAKKKILLFMSSADDSVYIGNILYNLGIECDTAENFNEAERCAEKDYDLIFASAEMLTSLSETERNKLMSLYDTEKVNVLSPYKISDETLSILRSYGLTHFFKNPATPNRLLGMVTKDISSDEIYKETVKRPENCWSSKSILLAEDMEINREIVLGLLEDSGVHIDTAENGQIALSMFTQNPEKYDVILMDIQMPVMDGITAAKAIRSSKALHSETIPIYAMTANAFKEDAENCIRAGMNGHIPKPIDIAELMKTLQKCFAD